MRLLLVEDDSMIGQSIEAGLRGAGFAVDWIRDGAAADLALATTAYDLIVLDLALPRQDGLELLRKLRRGGKAVPVLIVTARDSVSDRVTGLNAGADDYLVKPFDLDELIARVHALLRRNAGRASPELTVGNLVLNPLNHRVMLNDKVVNLSAREFALLHALMMAPGVAFSKDELEEKLYGWDEEVASNVIEVHLHNLRRKLGRDIIRNVRGVGYMVVAP